MSVSTIVQSINDVSDKMNSNAQQIEKLTDISSEVEDKINITSNAMQTSSDATKKAKETSIKMSHEIEGIIQNITDIEALSIANGTSAIHIEDDLEKLVSIANSLQATIDEFKS